MHEFAVSAPLALSGEQCYHIPCFVCRFANYNPLACWAGLLAMSYRSTCGCWRPWASCCGLPAVFHWVTAGRGLQNLVMQALPACLRHGLVARCHALQPEVLLPSLARPACWDRMSSGPLGPAAAALSRMFVLLQFCWPCSSSGLLEEQQCSAGQQQGQALLLNGFICRTGA